MDVERWTLISQLAHAPARRLALCLALVCVLPACHDAPKDPSSEPITLNLPPVEKEKIEGKVSLKDFISAPADPAAPQGAQRVLVRTLLFERGDPRLVVALDVLDAPPLDAHRRRLWEENGFRIGVADRGRLPMLMANLPKPVHSQTAAFYCVPNYNPVMLVDRVDPTARIKVVDADGSATFHHFTDGVCQMLVRVAPAPAGEPKRLELLPHHYSPVRSLLMRTPDDQITGGQRFEQLHVDRALKAGEVWVVTAEPPRNPRPRNSRSPRDSRNPDRTGDAGPEPRSAGSQPLAQAMLTGRSLDKDVQILLLIALEEEGQKP